MVVPEDVVQHDVGVPPVLDELDAGELAGRVVVSQRLGQRDRLGAALIAVIWWMSIDSETLADGDEGRPSLPLASADDLVTSVSCRTVAPAAADAVSVGSSTLYGRTECS